MSESGDDGRPKHFGGSIERTLAGDADLSVMPVIREAWEWVDGIKGMMAAGMLIIYAGVLAVTLLVTSLLGSAETGLGGALGQLAVMIIVYPFMAGVFMLGLRRSVGFTVRFEDQFAYYGAMLPIVAVGALQSLVTFTGFLLLVIPGIYLMFALSLAVPLKVERDLPMTDCLLVSLRLVNRKFFEVVILTLVAVALTVLGILSVIGWIWTIPWTMMILAIIYRQLAGYTPADSVPPKPGGSTRGTTGSGRLEV